MDGPPPVTVDVNDTTWLPGTYSVRGPLKPEEGKVMPNYTTGATSLPICLGPDPHFLTPQWQEWLVLSENGTKWDMKGGKRPVSHGYLWFQGQ